MGTRHSARQRSQYSAWRARRRKVLQGAATEPLVRVYLSFLLPNPMAIPSNHLTTGLEGSQLDKELTPVNMTVCSISPSPPEEIS